MAVVGSFSCFTAEPSARAASRLRAVDAIGDRTATTMTRHPTARRVNRPPRAGADDVFVERVLETTVWAKRNSRTLIVVGATLVVVILVMVYMRASGSAMRRNAETQLTQIRPTVLSGNAPLAIRDLETFLARYGDTPAAREARVLLGRAYLENQEAQKAVDLLLPHANDVADPLGVQTAMLLGAAYESLAQPAAAVDVYLRVGERAQFDYQKQLALDAAARVRLETGDAAGAVELYDRILTIIPDNGPDRPVYELRRAEAAARVPGGTGS